MAALFAKTIRFDVEDFHFVTIFFTFDALTGKSRPEAVDALPAVVALLLLELGHVADGLHWPPLLLFFDWERLPIVLHNIRLPTSSIQNQ